MNLFASLLVIFAVGLVVYLVFVYEPDDDNFYDSDDNPGGPYH